MAKSKIVTTREKLFKKALLEAMNYKNQLTPLWVWDDLFSEEENERLISDGKKAVLKKIYKKYKYIFK